MIIRHKIYGDTITNEQLLNPNQVNSNTKDIVKALFKVGIPFAIASAVMQISSLVDTVTVHTILKGMLAFPENETIIRGLYNYDISINSGEIPNMLFGCYSAALTFYNLIPMTTMPFGISAMPGLTAAYTLHNKKDMAVTIKSGLRLSALFSVPEGFLLSALSTEIMRTLYSGADVRLVGAQILAVIGVAGTFAGLCQPINSMLQSCGRFYRPIVLMGVGALIKVVVNYIFISIPQVNILGATVGTVCCFVFIFFAGVISLFKTADMKLSELKLFFPIFISGLACVATALIAKTVLYRFVSSTLIILVGSAAAAVLVYAFFVLITRSVTKNEIIMLPKGEKIAKTLEKWRWIR